MINEDTIKDYEENTYRCTTEVVHKHNWHSDISGRAVGERRRGVVLAINGELRRASPGEVGEGLELGLVVTSLVEETLDVSSGRVVTSATERTGAVAQLGKFDKLV